ncbi:hypothetical protein [Staphylococcus argensis]|uniref:Uncharacterized protein n=1 Tax=Staphylococcus argensis TaxID=1607738 RepID=A0A2K4FC07_9STAP|nr:hypothetical protein [Staphylococcus argensis]MCY6992050.1 hypothetical protein [Staphylococcus argensis]POA08892.1 hypothetical protein CD039_07840 [Staphylococcus argensis]
MDEQLIQKRLQLEETYDHKVQKCRRRISAIEEQILETRRFVDRTVEDYLTVSARRNYSQSSDNKAFYHIERFKDQEMKRLEHTKLEIEDEIKGLRQSYRREEESLDKEFRYE